MSQNRRQFLTTIGGATLGLAAGGRVVTAMETAAATRAKISRVGIQLYTLRTAAAADLQGTLSRLAKIGYKEIEFAGYYNHPASEIRTILDANGLTAPSAHIAITQIETAPDKTFEDARTVGHEWITVPSLPGGRKETVDAWKQVAAQFNTVAAQVKKAGFRFAYHNHNTEFRKVGDTVPLDVLIGETDPALVNFEMDIYWVVNGGGDPLDLLARYPGRLWAPTACRLATTRCSLRCRPAWSTAPKTTRRASCSTTTIRWRNSTPSTST